MPCGGIPGEIVFIDKPPDAIFSPTPSGNHSNPVGWKLTPPPVPPVLHVCPTVGTQAGEPNISNVLERVGEEVTEDFCCRYRVTDGDALLVVWDTADGSFLVQVFGTNIFILQQQLYGVGTEPTKVSGKVWTTGGALVELGSR